MRIFNYKFGSKLSYYFGSLTDPTYPHTFHLRRQRQNRRWIQRLYRSTKTVTTLTSKQSPSEGNFSISNPTFSRDISPNEVWSSTGVARGRFQIEKLTKLSPNYIDFFLGQALTHGKDCELYTNPCYERNIQLNIYAF